MESPFLDVLRLSQGHLTRLTEAVPALHRWYGAAARSLPWRRTRDPYAIWVSEAMLQQTRVAAVVSYYERWMRAFPTVEDLAAAGEDQVLKLWEGLGYYSRARNLHRAAREVMERFGGRIPTDPTEFLRLPGVGRYTAAAVLSIAAGADLAVLDGNVLRVLSRVVALDTDPRKPSALRALEALAARLLPSGTGELHNQALMELGALVCTPRSPACQACPLSGVCRAKSTGRQQDYPRKKPRKAIPHHHVAIAIVLRRGEVFIDQRPYGGLLGGLWEFPGGKVEHGESVEEALRRELREEFGMEVELDRPLPAVDHTYTHLRVTLHPWVCRFAAVDPRVGEGQPYRWVKPEELEHVAMPRANRKVLEALAAEKELLRSEAGVQKIGGREVLAGGAEGTS